MTVSKINTVVGWINSANKASSQKTSNVFGPKKKQNKAFNAITTVK